MTDDLDKLRFANQPDCLAQTLNRRKFLSVTGRGWQRVGALYGVDDLDG